MRFDECNINLSLVKPLTLAWFRFDCVNYRYFDRINVSCYVQIRQCCGDSYSVCWLLSCRVMIDWPMVGNMNPCYIWFNLIFCFSLSLTLSVCVFFSIISRFQLFKCSFCWDEGKKTAAAFVEIALILKINSALSI